MVILSAVRVSFFSCTSQDNVCLLFCPNVIPEIGIGNDLGAKKIEKRNGNNELP